MPKKHWTPTRIILIVLVLVFIIFKILTEDDIPTGGAIAAVSIGAIGALVYFVVKKKGIFSKQ